MKIQIKILIIFATLVLIVSLWPACAPREIKPPPQTGKIIAEFNHGPQAFNVKYSVGVLNDRIRIVGVIVNTYLSDLDYFKLSLNVINSGEKVVFKDSTPVFDIEEHGSHIFVFDLPFLRGPYRYFLHKKTRKIISRKCPDKSTY